MRPTNVEQSDLNIGLFRRSGDSHGVSLAPANVEDCFYLLSRPSTSPANSSVPVFI